MIEQLFPGGGGDELAKVSSNDTTAGYLNGKLVAGTNITFTENNNGSNETLTIAAAGGVTGFTGSQNTASPNNTVNASRLLVDATSTNADFVASPKGTGAFMLLLPDNAATGGNKRGTNAIDLQTQLSVNNQVASGASGWALGRGNRVDGANAGAIGYSNTSSGSGSHAYGESNQSQGTRSFAIGYSCNAATERSYAIGESCETGAVNAIAMGRSASISVIGAFAYAAGPFAAAGDAQHERYIMRRVTTDATYTELTTDGTAIAIYKRIAIANDTTCVFHGFVVGRRTDADNESAAYEIKGIIDNNAGTTAFVGTPTVTVISEDMAAWDVYLNADNTNDFLDIKVKGEASKTIRWVATIYITKVTG